jgi:hypothetical protein
VVVHLWMVGRFEGCRSELSSIDYPRSRRRRGSEGRPHSEGNGVVRHGAEFRRGRSRSLPLDSRRGRFSETVLLSSCSRLGSRTSWLVLLVVLGVVRAAAAPHGEHERSQLACERRVGAWLSTAFGDPLYPLDQGVTSQERPARNPPRSRPVRVELSPPAGTTGSARRARGSGPAHVVDGHGLVVARRARRCARLARPP